MIRPGVMRPSVVGPHTGRVSQAGAGGRAARSLRRKGSIFLLFSRYQNLQQPLKEPVNHVGTVFF
jgi:hypothetical protein